MKRILLSSQTWPACRFPFLFFYPFGIFSFFRHEPFLNWCFLPLVLSAALIRSASLLVASSFSFHSHAIPFRGLSFSSKPPVSSTFSSATPILRLHNPLPSTHSRNRKRSTFPDKPALVNFSRLRFPLSPSPIPVLAISTFICIHTYWQCASRGCDRNGRK